MRFLRRLMDQQKLKFTKGKMKKFYYAFEAFETFLFTPNHNTKGIRSVHVRDAIDLKRMMVTVIMAMLPCLLFGMWNVGHQYALATGEILSLWDKFLIGLKVTLPIIVVSYAAGLGVEFIFASIRKHSVNEGFLVTGMLIPLIMPPTIPLWQVAIATIFAVVVGKEVFGGTGMNILNVALTARAFLYFAYPSDISGSKVWTYLGGANTVDGYSGATALAVAAESTNNKVEAVKALGDSWVSDLFSFKSLVMGTVPGSIGETSVIMCLLGALLLAFTNTGSWKIIVSVFAGGFFMGWLMNLIGGNSFVELPAHYHLAMGGFAFGAVFMATDPVTATQTEVGKWFYGFLIGVLTILIRVFNPAYPEGIMLAILFMNVMAPLIDHFVINANKKRRLKRATV